jgi:6-pyruvoyltetrahydropterin/6-carboxytetrahydropterin synthase
MGGLRFFVGLRLGRSFLCRKKRAGARNFSNTGLQKVEIFLIRQTEPLRRPAPRATNRLFMPYRICKTIEIESGHQLSRHPDKCRFPHGHSRKVEFILQSPDLDANGMVCDFKIIKQAVGEWLDTLDHSLCMNTEDPMFETLARAYGERIIAFEGIDPTTEVMAKHIYDKATALLAEYAATAGAAYALRAGVTLARVRVWETSSSWAEYEP